MWSDVAVFFALSMVEVRVRCLHNRSGEMKCWRRLSGWRDVPAGERGGLVGKGAAVGERRSFVAHCFHCNYSRLHTRHEHHGRVSE